MGIVYKKMSLFDAPDGSILVHACNAQGSWGSGIAKEFKERFPIPFEKYSKACENFKKVKVNAAGKGFIFSDNKNNHIGCLITSEFYGFAKDSQELIKINTTIALMDFFTRVENMNLVPIYSNKFNSGLFNVPWEETELILETILKQYPYAKWIVCDPDLKNVGDEET